MAQPAVRPSSSPYGPWQGAARGAPGAVLESRHARSSLSGPSSLPGAARRAGDPVIGALTVAVSVAALLLAAWCGYATARDQSTKDWHFIGMAVVTVLALAQLVVGVVELARGRSADRGDVIFVSYLAGAALTVPAAGFMSLVERTRWGSAIAAAGGLVLAVLEIRLFDIWGGGHG